MKSIRTRVYPCHSERSEESGSASDRIAGGADVPFLGMSRPLSLKRGAYITTKGVVTYAPPARLAVTDSWKVYLFAAASKRTVTI